MVRKQSALTSIAAAIIATAAPLARATLLAYEGFNYVPGATLAGQNAAANQWSMAVSRNAGGGGARPNGIEFYQSPDLQELDLHQHLRQRRMGMPGPVRRAAHQ